MKQNITINDVAKRAGVSRATAGRVVGGYGNTSEESKRKVLQAVKELNYRPNLLAQSLRSQSTKTIAVISGSIKNNYCNKLIYAVEKEAQKDGYNVIICNTNESIEQEIRHLQDMHSRHVDGIVLMSACPWNQQITQNHQTLYQGSIPIVFVDRRINGIQASVIQSNNFESSYQATKYLLELGHKNIGVIATDHYSTVLERIDGYKQALSDYHIPFQSEMLQYAAMNDTQHVAAITDQFLNQNPKATAIYLLNNSLCTGVLLELKKQNLKIPNDISLLVWDDEDFNELLDITTIVQPIEEIGRIAITKLLALNSSEHLLDNPTQEILNTRIEYRKSCSKLYI